MEQVLEYAKSLGGNPEITEWLLTAGSKAVKARHASISDLEHIVDWLYSSSAPKRLKRLSVVDAKRMSREWMEKNKAKGKNLEDSESDIQEFMSFQDESKIVKLLSKKAFEREGNLMSHCLGGYSTREGYDIYSLRDKSNQPHATFEVSTKDSDILQIKGKGNGSIHPKYIHRVLAFLKKLGMDIRPSEMVNLGYYCVPQVHLEFIKSKMKKEKLIEIAGEFYIV
jgi:hypothetical protein